MFLWWDRCKSLSILALHEREMGDFGGGQSLCTRMRLWELPDQYVLEPTDSISRQLLAIDRSNGNLSTLGNPTFAIFCLSFFLFLVSSDNKFWHFSCKFSSSAFLFLVLDGYDNCSLAASRSVAFVCLCTGSTCNNCFWAGRNCQASCRQVAALKTLRLNLHNSKPRGQFQLHRFWASIAIWKCTDWSWDCAFNARFQKSG